MKSIKVLILSILFVLTGIHLYAQTTEISGNLPLLMDGDTIQVRINQYPDFPFGSHLYQENQVPVRNHSFLLTFECPGPYSYISFSLKNKNTNTIPGSYLVRPGDQVCISAAGDRYLFSGKSSLAFETQYKVMEIIHGTPIGIHFTPENLNAYFRAIDASAKAAQIFLDELKDRLNAEVYGQVSTNITIDVNWQKYYEMNFWASHKKDSVRSSYQQSYRRYIGSLPGLSDDIKIDERFELHSGSFASYVYYKYNIDSCFMRGTSFSEHQYLDYVRSRFSDELREKLSAYVLLERLNRTKEDLQPDFALVIANSTDSELKKTLISARNARYGRGGLNYSLTDEHGKKVDLKSFQGKVVLLDFFYTGCGNCVRLAPILRKVEDELLGKNVVFVSVSIDKSREQWLSSVRSQQYSSFKSLNLYTSGNGTNDPVIIQNHIDSYPTLLLVGKDGRLTSGHFADPRTDNGSDLKNAIHNALSK